MKNTKIRDFNKETWKLQPLNFELEAMFGNSRLEIIFFLWGLDKKLDIQCCVINWFYQQLVRSGQLEERLWQHSQGINCWLNPEHSQFVLKNISSSIWPSVLHHAAEALLRALFRLLCLENKNTFILDQTQWHLIFSPSWVNSYSFQREHNGVEECSAPKDVWSHL